MWNSHQRSVNQSCEPVKLVLLHIVINKELLLQSVGNIREVCSTVNSSVCLCNSCSVSCSCKLWNSVKPNARALAVEIKCCKNIPFEGHICRERFSDSAGREVRSSLCAMRQNKANSSLGSKGILWYLFTSFPHYLSCCGGIYWNIVCTSGRWIYSSWKRLQRRAKELVKQII